MVISRTSVEIQNVLPLMTMIHQKETQKSKGKQHQSEHLLRLSLKLPSAVKLLVN